MNLKQGHKHYVSKNDISNQSIAELNIEKEYMKNMEECKYDKEVLPKNKWDLNNKEEKDRFILLSRLH